MVRRPARLAQRDARAVWIGRPADSRLRDIPLGADAVAVAVKHRQESRRAGLHRERHLHADLLHLAARVGI